MSDMREPVTVDFHRAKRHADGLRPAEDEKPDADRLGEYRVAVRDLQVAFDIAEREARRRRAMDFPFEERRSLDRAKRLIALAEDSGAKIGRASCRERGWGRGSESVVYGHREE